MKRIMCAIGWPSSSNVDIVLGNVYVLLTHFKVERIVRAIGWPFPSIGDCVFAIFYVSPPIFNAFLTLTL